MVEGNQEGIVGGVMCISDRKDFFFKQKTAYENRLSLVGSECV